VKIYSIKFFRFVICLVSLLLVTISAFGQDYVPGEIIVKLKSDRRGQPTHTFLSKAQSQKELNLKRSWGKLNMYHFQTKVGQSVEQAVEELRRDPDVVYAEPNYIYKKATDFKVERIYDRNQVLAASRDNVLSAYEAQIGLAEVHTFASSLGLSHNQTDNRPIVALLDTGLDVNHPVFVESKALWVNKGEIPNNGIDDDGNGYVDDINGYNFIKKTGDLWDGDGHGTHVAGIVLKVSLKITADSQNMQQSAIRLMPLKFLDDKGQGTTSDAIEAIYYALRNGATVLNNSWGGPAYSTALLDAVVASYNAGVVFVAAAGNFGSDNDLYPIYPASYTVPHIQSVAATTDEDHLASFSNYGKNSVHVGSPGKWIMSTYPQNRWAHSSGTSMAAPFVSGVAALMKAVSPNMLGYQIKTLTHSNTHAVSYLKGKLTTEGRLSPQGAIDAVSTASVETSQPRYSPIYMANVSRELASELSGGGCGLVNQLYQNFNRGQGVGGSEVQGLRGWSLLITLALILLPLVLRSWLRSRKPVNYRRYPRYEIQTDVTLNLGDKKLKGEVSSISLGGLCVNTDAWLDQGGVISMTISSPDGKEQVQVEGKIVWSEEQRSYGMAFDKENTGSLALSTISGWLKGLRKVSY